MRRIALGLILVIVFVLSVGTAHAALYAGGSGTANDPYQIANVNQLQNIKNDLNAHFILINDINASETSGWYSGNGFDPLGETPNYPDYGTPFTGFFDGQGHIISNLYINRSSSENVGLFGYMKSGIIKDISLVNSTVIGKNYVGGIIGWLKGLGSITNCYSNGFFSGRQWVGGLAGTVYRGNVTKSYSTGSVTGKVGIGGLAGQNYDGIIMNSYSTCSVTGNDRVGGFVSYLNNNGHIINCYSTGAVNGSTNVGGFVGGTSSTGSRNITNCFWDNQTSGQSASNAGSTGKSTAEMKNIATYTDTSTAGLGSAWDFIGDPNDDTGSGDHWDISSTINNGYPNLITEKPLSCGDTITADETLTADLANCSGTGLIIGAGNITLDCQGHVIEGTNSAGSMGINNTAGHDNFSMRNCEIKSFEKGIVDGFIGPGVTNFAEKGTIESNTIHNITATDYQNLLVGSGKLYSNNTFSASFITLFSNVDNGGQVTTAYVNLTSNTFNSGLFIIESTNICAENNILNDNILISGNHPAPDQNNTPSYNIMLNNNDFRGNELDILNMTNSTISNNHNLSSIVINGSGNISINSNLLCRGKSSITLTANSYDNTGDNVCNKVIDDDSNAVTCSINCHPKIKHNSSTPLVNIGDNITIATNWTDTNLACLLYVDGKPNQLINSSGSWCNFTYATTSGDHGTRSFYVNATNARGFSNTSSTMTSTVNAACGSIISTDFTLSKNLACAADGLIIGGDNITVDCDNHNITGASTGKGISITNHNVSLSGCNIRNFTTGVLISGTGNTISDNVLTHNRAGISSSSKNNFIRNNNISSSDCLGMNITKATTWDITARNKIQDNDLIFNGTLNFKGILELDNSHLTLNNVFINMTGNFTNLGMLTKNAAVDTPTDYDFSDLDANITITLGNTVKTTMAVGAKATMPSSSLTAVKGVDIDVDDGTSRNLTWAYIKIYYTASEISGLDESSLKIYYYNESASDWQREPNQGVNKAKNYVWANITHFSLFGVFGNPLSSNNNLGGGGGGGGGGGYCSPTWECTAWSGCKNGQQTRTCIDRWNCHRTAGKPAETRKCTAQQDTPETPDSEPEKEETVKESIPALAPEEKKKSPEGLSKITGRDVAEVGKDNSLIAALIIGVVTAIALISGIIYFVRKTV